MGNGLDDAVIDGKSCLDEILAVAGDGRTADVELWVLVLINLTELGGDAVKRLSLIRCVMAVQQPSVLGIRSDP